MMSPKTKFQVKMAIVRRFFQTVKEKLISIFLRLSQKVKEIGIFPSFYEFNINQY